MGVVSTMTEAWVRDNLPDLVMLVIVTVTVVVSVGDGDDELWRQTMVIK